MNNKIIFALLISVFITVSLAETKKSLSIQKIWKLEGDTIGINGLKSFNGYSYISATSSSDIEFENLGDTTSSTFKIPEYIFIII